MTLSKITDSKSQLFIDAWKIYLDSFPKETRRDLNGQVLILNNPNYDFFVLSSDSKVQGLLCIWTFEDFIFVEHLAIRKNLQGKGLGKTTLNEFLKNEQKLVVLEVDRPGETPDSNKVISFYKDLGFVLNDYDYIQPAYGEDKKSVSLFLMSYPREIGEEEYLEIRDNLHKFVYGLEKSLTKI